MACLFILKRTLKTFSVVLSFKFNVLKKANALLKSELLAEGKNTNSEKNFFLG